MYPSDSSFSKPRGEKDKRQLGATGSVRSKWQYYGDFASKSGSLSLVGPRSAGKDEAKNKN